MSTRGITLESGQIAVLSLDGTLVYVEEVQPTYAAVVAFPEQPGAGERVLMPGRVGARKISPYSRPDRIVPREELSERNKTFLETYGALRAAHGPNYVQRTPEEEAKMAVIKAGPKPRVPRSEAPVPIDKSERRKARREQKRVCVKCGKMKRDHAGTNTCDFEGKPTREEKAAGPKVVKNSDPIYRVISTDLTKAQAASDKFAEGNRFWRVFRALNSLDDQKGTLRDVIAKLALDGGRVMTDMEKVSRRALKQLLDAGNVVLDA